MVSQVDLAKRGIEDQVADPCTRVLKVRAPLCLLLELNEHHPHNVHLEGINRRSPEHGLHSGRNHHPKRGKLPGHLGMTDGGNLHPIRYVDLHSCGANYGQAQLGIYLVCRRVNSLTKSWYYLSAYTCRRLMSATLSKKPWKFTSAMSQAQRASMSAPSKRVTFHATSSGYPLRKAKKVVPSIFAFNILS
jgi:hypothetical protein